jgi:hypothetical protein
LCLMGGIWYIIKFENCVQLTKNNVTVLEPSTRKHIQDLSGALDR